MKIVTLLGEWPLSRPWVLPCMRSWSRIVGIKSEILAISDGSLSEKHKHAFQNLQVTFDPDQQEGNVMTLLEKYPTLIRIREKDLTWRKILDVTAMLGSYNGVTLLIDTDVFIRKKVKVDPKIADGSLVYMREDIPAYAAKWSVVRENMVLSFNAGMVLFQRPIIDLDFLEYIVNKYIINIKNYWWSEQLAWSLLAGRTPKRFFWDGDSARVISGFGTRTPDEISLNIVKMFSKRRLIGSGDEMLSYCGNAPVIHMAGGGKKWYQALMPGSDNEEAFSLKICPDPLLRFSEKIKIGARLHVREHFT